MTRLQKLLLPPFNYDGKPLRLNRLTLSFDGELAVLEAGFRQVYYSGSLYHVRISILIGMLIYGLFGILDGVLAPAMRDFFWTIRFAIVCPVALVALLFSYSRYFSKFMQLTLAGIVVVAGLGIVVMIVLAPPPVSYSYYAGLILIFIYGYTYLRIRFIWSTIAGWVIVAAYEITAVWIIGVPWDVLINNNFFFICSNVLGMLASYSIEYFMRKDYFQVSLLKSQQAIVAATNQRLEERVAERTAQLEKINLQLKAEITERKQAESALRLSEEKYRLLAVNATDVIWTLELATMQFTYFSPSVMTTLGFSPQEAMSHAPNKSVTQASMERCLQTLFEELENECQRGGDPDRFRILEVETYKRDGGTIWLEIKVRFLRNEEGQPIGLLGASRDITYRKTAETALRESEEKYRDLVENLNDVIYAVDMKGRVTFVSSVIESAFGYPPAEIIGGTFDRLVHEDYRPQLAKHFRDVISGEKQNSEYLAFKKNKEMVWLRSSSRPIYKNGEIIGLRGMLTDITERKHTQEQLIQFEKMAALGRLVAGVAHEINTPVGVGITASSFLEDNTQKYHRLHERGEMTSASLIKFMRLTSEASSIIHANLRRAADLINSFKQVAVDQTNEAFRKFHLKQYIEETLLSLRPEYMRTRHQIIVDCDADIEFYSSPGAFSQIITNLVINSLTHGFENVSHGIISIKARENGKNLLLEYSDNGKGMDAKTLKKMYDPFFTTNRMHGGSGLGMHIVYNLISQTLGGRIECHSGSGQGVTFLITVPLNDPDVQGEARMIQ